MTLLNRMECMDLTCELEDFPDPYEAAESNLDHCSVMQSNFRMDGGSGTPSTPTAPETDSPSNPSIPGTDPSTTLPFSDAFPTISPIPDTFPITDVPYSRPSLPPTPINSSAMPIGVTGAIMFTSSITIGLADILFPNIAF